MLSCPLRPSGARMVANFIVSFVRRISVFARFAALLQLPRSLGWFEKCSHLSGHGIYYGDDVDLDRGSVGSPFGVGGAGIDLGL